ncbi:MAG TPA: Do family serine endopeptidase, partial [bacterium (Candidatus Stahlbacteria)]|nr:Do family serine endopeptidase [Candidatus Stahlbacteria bacterium]
DPDGYIVTNNHVVKGAEDIIIKLYSGEEFKGNDVKIVGTDQRTDIALIKVKTKKKLPVLKLGSSEGIEVGDWAIAVGNPFHFEGTVTVGVISAKGRSGLALPEGPVYQNFIQTDAAINPGNSGGPLVNIRGEVIGINTAITSPSGGNIGIGFAIPIDLARKVISELKEKGHVERGYLGVYPQEITEDLREGLDLPSTEGILVRDVLPNTPADRAGIKPGDVIIEFDHKKVKDVNQFRLMVAETPIGKRVEIIVWRDGKEKKLRTKIGQFPEEIAQTTKEARDLGIMVREVSEPETGVAIEKVTAGSIADQAGLKVGDLIVRINRRRIKTLKDYMQTLTEENKKEVLVFQIKRKGKTYFITIRRR